jgi:hypothetical protein
MPSDREAMGWGAWMCVEQTPELDFELQRCKVEINRASESELRQFAVSMYQSYLVQQATRHIAELECREAIRERPRPGGRGWWSQLVERLKRPQRAG